MSEQGWQHRRDAIRTLWSCSALVLALALCSCAATSQPSTHLPAASADVLIVPGCPSEDDGTVSRCQWRRAVWAAHLVQQGFAARVLVSGSSVHNRWLESDGLAAALASLGLPTDRISAETQALHTDENIAYSLRVAETLGCRTVMVAGDGRLQTRGMCAMARHWGWACTEAPPPRRWVKSRLDAGYPRIQTEPESLDSWRPWQEREAERAKRAGSTPRSHSMFRYLGMRLRSGSGRSNPQPEPPGPEPSLQPGSGC